MTETPPPPYTHTHTLNPPLYTVWSKGVQFFPHDKTVSLTLLIIPIKILKNITVKVLNKTVADNFYLFIFFFSEKIKLIDSCELSARQVLHALKKFQNQT